jgi:hypothetical protein
MGTIPASEASRGSAQDVETSQILEMREAERACGADSHGNDITALLAHGRAPCRYHALEEDEQVPSVR